MRQALECLSSWFAKEPQTSNLGKTLENLQSKWPSGLDELDKSRRRVAHYFQHIHVLWKRTKLLDDVTARAAVDKERAGFYLTYVEPLEWAKRRDYERETFDFFASEYGLQRRLIPGYPNWYKSV
jgi:hypothetical protein